MSTPGDWPIANRKRTPLDNANLGGKLALRRHFLDRYHRDTRPVVLDCCQGDAALWSRLRREYPVTYWGVDQKERRGRMAVDSSRLLARPGLPYDVIDVDTYGTPWGHWFAMLPNLVKPTTVFLTYGRLNLTGIDSNMFEVLGARRLAKRMPHTLAIRLHTLALDACFAKCYIYNIRIIEALEVIPEQRARYFGFRLHPATIEGDRHG